MIFHRENRNVIDKLDKGGNGLYMAHRRSILTSILLAPAVNESAGYGKAPEK